ncbi:hypothetical protein VCHA40P240_40211 [Vibrio chagasii]|nr:hypothetical protein VCHA40P240_40211 [Vibrio chagasii]
MKAKQQGFPNLQIQLNDTLIPSIGPFYFLLLTPHKSMCNATAKLNLTIVKIELNYWMENDMRWESLLNGLYIAP